MPARSRIFNVSAARKKMSVRGVSHLPHERAQRIPLLLVAQLVDPAHVGLPLVLRGHDVLLPLPDVAALLVEQRARLLQP